MDEALSTATQLDHYFFFADQSDADRAAQCLQERGWTIESVSLNAEVEKVQLQARQPGPIENLNALQTVGYSEIIDHLEGKLSLPDAIERIKINTRQYAKRQMTWFKKDKEIKWFSPAQFDEMSGVVLVN